MAVAVFWFTGLSSFVVYSFLSQNTVVVRPSVQDIASPVNCITDVRLFHKDPDNENASFSFSFDSLRTQNGSLGMFKTAMQRMVSIEGLRIGIYDRSFPDSDEKLLTDSPLSMSRTADYISQRLAEYLVNPLDSQDDYTLTLGVDFRNIVKLFIVDLQFDHFRSGTPDLSVQSKTARTHPEQSGLLLRGHVVIDTHDGKKLQCNKVVWDMTDETFTAKGRYALDHDGMRRTGENIRLDRNLNEITVSQNTSMNNKEMQKCYARSQ